MHPRCRCGEKQQAQAHKIYLFGNGRDVPYKRFTYLIMFIFFRTTPVSHHSHHSSSHSPPVAMRKYSFWSDDRDPFSPAPAPAAAAGRAAGLRQAFLAAARQPRVPVHVFHEFRVTLPHLEKPRLQSKSGHAYFLPLYFNTPAAPRVHAALISKKTRREVLDAPAAGA